MNSFETDMFRAVFSRRFLCGLVLELVILFYSGFGGELFWMSVPLVCTLPYACGWLDEYKHGFVKFALTRSSVRGYIFGKFFSCGIAGGLCEVTAAWIYVIVSNDESITCEYGLIFLSGILWASVAATLAALSNSKYVAYGGAFVIYYFLVILHDRYWAGLYCLYPYEWIAPQHVWFFDETGIILMLAGMISVIAMVYYFVIERRIERV